MQRSEELMSEFPEINFNFDPKFPNLDSALIFDNTVYLNPKMAESKQVSILAEEIGHAKTTVGNIVDYADPRNWAQEVQARHWGFQLAVPLMGIVEALKNDETTDEELAGHFGVSEEYLAEALEFYRSKYGIEAHIDKFTIKFDPALSVTQDY